MEDKYKKIGKQIMERKCCNCMFFSGVRCQGHGEYFGSCELNCSFYLYNDSKCIFNEEGQKEIEDFIKHYAEFFKKIAYSQKFLKKHLTNN